MDKTEAPLGSFPISFHNSFVGADYYPELLGYHSYECLYFYYKYSVYQSPLTCGFAFHSFSYPKSTTVQKQKIFLLMYNQKVISSLALCHDSYIIHCTSSHRVSILPYHITIRRVSTVRYFKRPHSHDFYHIVIIVLFY